MDESRPEKSKQEYVKDVVMAFVITAQLAEKFALAVAKHISEYVTEHKEEFEIFEEETGSDECDQH